MNYFTQTKGSQFVEYLLYLKQVFANDTEGVINCNNNKLNKRKDDSFDQCWEPCIEIVNYIYSLIKPTNEKRKGKENRREMLTCVEDAMDRFYQTHNHYYRCLNILCDIYNYLDFNQTKSQILCKLDNNDNLTLMMNDLSVFIKYMTNTDTLKTMQFFQWFSNKVETIDKQFANEINDAYETTEIERQQVVERESNPNSRQGSNDLARQNIRDKRVRQKMTIGTRDTFKNHCFATIKILIQQFIQNKLKPLNEIELSQVFVFGANNNNINHYQLFEAQMFPFSNKLLRERLLNPESILLQQETNANESINENNFDYTKVFEKKVNQPKTKKNKKDNKSILEIENEAMSKLYHIRDKAEQYVNLYDAYCLFKDDYHSYDDDSQNDENENNNENENIQMSEKDLQCRFRMSLDDLRFCGLIKTTNRKKDHIIKLDELL